MVEQYVHTLIARPADAAPTAAQVQAFVQSALEFGVVPGHPEVALRIISGYNELPNPFTGKMVRVPRKQIRAVKSHELSHEIPSTGEYEVAVNGEGRPRCAPLPLPSDSPHEYSLAMTIVVAKESRSTSDTYNGFNAPLVETPMFGTPCTSASTTGYFSNLHTGTVITVPEGGAARFWIEFELGKFLFPPINDRLDLLEPRIVNEAHRIFGIDFVQGCRWLA